MAALGPAAGAALLVCATLSLSWQLAWARWLSAGIGLLVIALPIVFITPNAAAYLSDTLVGALIFGLAVGTPPEVGPQVMARKPAPEMPPGWSFNPSAWTQRIPIIVAALLLPLYDPVRLAEDYSYVQHLAEFGFNRNEARMYLAALGRPARPADLRSLGCDRTRQSGCDRGRNQLARRWYTALAVGVCQRCGRPLRGEPLARGEENRVGHVVPAESGGVKVGTAADSRVSHALR